MPHLDIPLGALLGAAARAERPDRRGIPEAQAQHLREMLDRYRAPNPFQPGDLVTPRAASNLKGAGDLHIVLEVIPPVMPSFRSDACCGEGRLDIRIGWLDRDGDERAAWVESYQLEPHPAGVGAGAGRHQHADADGSAEA